MGERRRLATVLVLSLTNSTAALRMASPRLSSVRNSVRTSSVVTSITAPSAVRASLAAHAQGSFGRAMAAQCSVSHEHELHCLGQLHEVAGHSAAGARSVGGSPSVPARGTTTSHDWRRKLNGPGCRWKWRWSCPSASQPRRTHGSNSRAALTSSKVRSRPPPRPRARAHTTHRPDR